MAFKSCNTTSPASLTAVDKNGVRCRKSKIAFVLPAGEVLAFDSDEKTKDPV